LKRKEFLSFSVGFKAKQEIKIQWRKLLQQVKKQTFIMAIHPLLLSSNLIFCGPWDFIKEGIIKGWQKLGWKIHHTLRNQETHILCLLSQNWSQVIHYILPLACFKEELLELHNALMVLLSTKPMISD